jgi:hypothetical protein
MGSGQVGSGRTGRWRVGGWGIGSWTVVHRCLPAANNPEGNGLNGEASFLTGHSAPACFEILTRVAA